MPDTDEILEYELIKIEFEESYEQTGFAREDIPSDKLQIEYDADGIPMGDSKEESAIRRKYVYDFIQKWREEHQDNPYVFNDNLKEEIKVNQVFLLESVSHAAYSYFSTKAVLRMEEVLSKAGRTIPTRPKAENANQKPFEKMLVLRYKFEDLGVAKLTVGVRKSTHEKVEYSITVPDPNKQFIDPELLFKPKKTQKKHHR